MKEQWILLQRKKKVMEDKFIVLEFMKANFQMEIQLVGVEQFIMMEVVIQIVIVPSLLPQHLHQRQLQHQLLVLFLLPQLQVPQILTLVNQVPHQPLRILYQLYLHQHQLIYHHHPTLVFIICKVVILF